MAEIVGLAMDRCSPTGLVRGMDWMGLELKEKDAERFLAWQHLNG
jgi:hypothetical protein